GRRISYFTKGAGPPIVGSLSGGRSMSGEIGLRRDGYVATITIDNVAKRNAMTQAMWIAMGDAVLALGSDTQLRCIVIRGKGAQAFGSGADIDEFEKIR